MDFNRNQFFMAGVLLLLLGLQFRMVDTFTLNEKTTRFLANRLPDSEKGALAAFLPAAGPIPRKVVRPPDWLGYAMLSIGSVVVLHSLAMPKPGGG